MLSQTTKPGHGSRVAAEGMGYTEHHSRSKHCPKHCPCCKLICSLTNRMKKSLKNWKSCSFNFCQTNFPSTRKYYSTLNDNRPLYIKN